MPKAACGHTVDLWCANANTVCKTCFEGRGLVYNLNSFRDIDDKRPRPGTGMTTASTRGRQAQGFHSEWSYTTGRCRCDECRNIATANRRDRRARAAA